MYGNNVCVCVCVCVGGGGGGRRRQREKKERPDLQYVLIIFHPIHISPQFNYSSTRIIVIELFEIIHVTNH